jgi:hypothetical protein
MSRGQALWSALLSIASCDAPRRLVPLLLAWACAARALGEAGRVDVEAESAAILDEGWQAWRAGASSAQALTEDERAAIARAHRAAKRAAARRSSRERSPA